MKTETLEIIAVEGEIAEIDILEEVTALGTMEGMETTEEMIETIEKTSEMQKLMEVVTETAEEVTKIAETDRMKDRERDLDQEYSPQRRLSRGGRRRLLLRTRTTRNRYLKFIMLRMMIMRS